MVFLGFERGPDKLLSGWVQTRYVTEVGQSYGWSITTGSGVEIVGANAVQSTLLAPTFPVPGELEGGADYDDLPVGYYYGIGAIAVSMALTRERLGLARWYDEYLPAHAAAWRLTPNPGTQLKKPYSGGYLSTSVGVWLNEAAPVNSYDIPVGWSACDDGRAELLDFNDESVVVSGQYAYTPNGYTEEVIGLSPLGVYIPLNPWFLANWPGDPYTFGVPRLWNINEFAYRPFDGTWKLNFSIRLFQWAAVYGPDGGTWPPTVTPPSVEGETTFIAHTAPDYLYRAYEDDPNVVVERTTRRDTPAWASVIIPFAGHHPCVAQDVTGVPWVLYTDLTNVKRRNVLTGAETTMASGKRPFERWSPGFIFRMLTYWRVTGAGPNGVVYYRRYDQSGAAMDGSEQTLVSDVPEQAVSLDWSANGTITALYSDGSSVLTKTSTDNGATWA